MFFLNPTVVTVPLGTWSDGEYIPRPKVHTKARNMHPDYPSRSWVNDAHVPWSVPYPEYAPVDYTAQVVLTNDRSVKPNGWADPLHMPQEEIASRESYEGKIHFDLNGSPLNPRGRTGMIGRGLLGKWGPNHAADPIVIVWWGDSIYLVAIKRGDTDEWAIPGGMVDAGEQVSATLRREFSEEAGKLSPALADKIFAHGREVYKGYVDDPRNTDNAWMETTVVAFVVDDEATAKELITGLEAGDDAVKVALMELDHDARGLRCLVDGREVGLYASHKEFVEKALSVS